MFTNWTRFRERFPHIVFWVVAINSIEVMEPHDDPSGSTCGTAKMRCFTWPNYQYYTYSIYIIYTIDYHWIIYIYNIHICIYISGWWFGTCFIFHNIWDNPSHWLVCFKMVKATRKPLDWSSLSLELPELGGILCFQTTLLHTNHDTSFIYIRIYIYICILYTIDYHWIIYIIYIIYNIYNIIYIYNI